MVHQHFSLIGKLSVTDNILLGQRQLWRLSRRRRAQVAERIAALAEQHGLPCDPLARVADLSVAEQQRVEILKALYQDARLLLFDEPTAVLTPVEAEALRRALLALARAGCTIVYVSHKLDEVFALAERITVMRAGRTVLSAVPTAATTPAAIARQIVGDLVGDLGDGPLLLAPAPPAAGEQKAKLASAPALALTQVFATGAVGADALCGLSLRVQPGEIYGLAGVAGNGQSELCEVLVGLRRPRRGELQLFGQEAGRLSVAERRARGLAYIPADRYAQGCAPGLSLSDNLLLTHLDAAELRSSWPLLLSRAGVRRFVERVLAPLGLPAGLLSRNPAAGALSGGTLQKLILARELAHQPRILVAAYPCRGLDLGAMQTVHGLLRQARDSGCAVLLLSEQLDELTALCARIGALVRGRIVGEVTLGDGPAGLSRPQAHRLLGDLISGLSAEAATGTAAPPLDNSVSEGEGIR
jgi:simple sugar transport system ATP-binding protein